MRSGTWVQLVGYGHSSVSRSQSMLAIRRKRRAKYSEEGTKGWPMKPDWVL